MWSELSFWLQMVTVSSHGREKDFSLPLLTRPQSYQIRTPPHLTLITFPKILSPDMVTLEVKVSIYEFRGTRFSPYLQPCPAALQSSLTVVSVMWLDLKCEASRGLKSTRTFAPNLLHSWACSRYLAVRTCPGWLPGVTDRSGGKPRPS